MHKIKVFAANETPTFVFENPVRCFQHHENGTNRCRMGAKENPRTITK